MQKLRKCVALFLAVTSMLSGCVMQQGQEKIEDLEFTVMDPVDLPKELQEEIIAKQEEEFAFTYSDREYLYIARGYGEQETGGYCISIDECYRTSNTICVKTTLTGSENGEQVQTAPSYPFIVIKLEMRSEEVVFQ